MLTTLQPFIAAVASGAVVGLLLTVFGGGGSVLATPLLLYVVGVRDAHVAIGTAAAAVSLNAAGGLLVQARAGRVKWPCALVFGGAGLAGSLIGSSLAKTMDGGRLLLLFALAMAAVALSMLRARRDEGDPQVRLTPGLAWKLAPVGLVTGLAAGFFGIGGGFLIVPGLVVATGMPLINAIASSLVSVTSFGATTAANYALSGLVDWWIALLLLAGGAVGGIAGAATARHLSGRRGMLATAFAVIVGAAGLYVVWRGAAAILG